MQFQLTAVRVIGSTVLSEQELAAATAPYVGRPATFDDLQRLTGDLEQLYRDRDFLAVRAVIPAQTIEGGVLTILIVEGFVENVVIRGDLGRAAPAAQALLARLVESVPLPFDEAERILLLTRDIPGIALQAALRQSGSGQPGALVLLVDAAHQPVDGFVAVTNLGSDEVGPITVSGGVAVNSALVAGDRLQAVVLVTPEDTSEQLVGQLLYELPLGVPGLTGKISVSNGISEPGSSLEPVELSLDSLTGDLSVEYDLIRRRARTVTLRGGLSFTRQEQDSVAGVLVDEDLRVAFAGIRWVESDLAGGTLDVDLELRQGLDGLGASQEGDLVSPIGADPQFSSARVDLSFGRVVGPLSVRLRASGMVSSGDVPSLETFSLGNYTYGRGFDPGTLTGDQGLAASLEVAYATPFQAGPVRNLELFGFYDAGLTETRTLDDNLSSAGGGVRFRITDRVSVEGFVARQLDLPTGDSERDTSGLFRITASF